MSEQPKGTRDAGESAANDEESDDEIVRKLLKRTLGTDVVARNAPDLLGGVQRRIRRRSKGKFFADGWSTGQTKISYVLVALVTLVLVALAYFALGPMDVR
ncbi:MAG: hypothetical protein ABSE49_24885 [Polyangiaceae bacterium]|jgi:hypothetical protein